MADVIAGIINIIKSGFIVTGSTISKTINQAFPKDNSHKKHDPHH